ncbi:MULTISPECIES: helix-turn-helix domain-containing protein [unclassified Cupriavidus]|uniref:helix-turn-helix domain-containing protein n=1 Tax=unclassified Cupriavidus TaxID=2640874 RepID=UPI001C006983|nr:MULTISPECIES: helix-turn-helix domain-containing protein [unclassified Cupriavidus]MCA3188308.1 helix-turn-helix domain-containing protein [Cupriavidus sp.]MCA3189838.1 helix-turn-helix domain-containing protein [Cupriavidus sp.]MCA3196432.1 helix-turn-helix domain-containing protein [Cupriavidus sp.]MCA3202177.1 helix-turn-helix domain-containing protein [Cupriavidus sp.]MCA3234332.1 helix-turn-helix domain-containing protein [Cupriavidus sp.]
MTADNVAKRAIKAAGGAPAVARLFGINPVSVYDWINNNRIPAERCPALERAGKSEVRCEEMRPDVDWGYLREHAVAAAA